MVQKPTNKQTPKKNQASRQPIQVASIAKWKELGLEASVRFDPFRWSDSDRLSRASSTALRWCRIQNNRGNLSKIDLRLMRVILLNLLSTRLKDDKLFCSYSRDRNDYVNVGRYNPTRFSFKAVSLIDALGREGFIENYRGVQFGEFKRQARMRLTRSGHVTLIKDSGVQSSLAAERVSAECIILRGKDPKTGKQVDKGYTDTNETIQMRKRLRAYNALIAKHDINVRNFPAEGIPRGKHEPNYMVDYSRNELSRIFSNGNWKEGGRFYRAWWVNLPKEWRRMIYIDGKPTVELDFSAMHPAIAYALEGLNIFEAVGPDPYVIPEFSSEPRMRPLAKLILNTALNAKSRSDTISSVNREINFGSPEFGWFRAAGLKVESILDRMEELHHPIKQWICTNRATFLQFIDSRIADAVMTGMTKKGVPVLVIHDSFVCAVTEADGLKASMEAAYKKVLGEIRKKGASVHAAIKESGVGRASWETFLRVKDSMKLPDFDSLLELIGQPRDPASAHEFENARLENSL